MAERQTDAGKRTEQASPDPSVAATTAQTSADRVEDDEECSHTWTIDRPNQQVSHGRCLECGAEKDFLNYGEELRMPFGRRRRG